MEPENATSIVWDPDEEGDARIVTHLPPGVQPDDEELRGDPEIPGADEGDPDELRAKLEDLREAAGLVGEDLLARAPRAFLTPEIRAEDEKKRILRFVISTEDVGRDGDIIRVAGWDFAPFRKNPVWLWGHERWTPPIGRVTELVKDVPNLRVEASVQFMDAEMDPFADLVYRMHRARFLRGTSVSWIPKKVTRPDDDMRKELKLGPWGVIHEKAELLEASSVTVPADRKALLKSVGEGAVRGLLGPRDVELARRALGESKRESDRETFEAFREAWETLHRVVVSDDTVRRLNAMADRMHTDTGKRASDADPPELDAPEGEVPGRRDLYADLFDEDGSTARRLETIADRLGA